jgi:hypothetical protein
MGPHEQSSGGSQTISIKLEGLTARAFLRGGESVTDDGGGVALDIFLISQLGFCQALDGDKGAVMAGEFGKDLRHDGCG